MLGDSLYLENIQEYVQDEDRIVTYKWLSRKLDVPVDAAKRMLYAYVRRSADELSEAPVAVTYAVTGVQTDQEGGKVHRVYLVDEDQLTTIKEQLDSVWGIHVYSVHKGKLKDSGALYAADDEANQQYLDSYSRWSPIDCPNPPASVRTRIQSQTPERTSEPQKRVTRPPPKLPTLSHMPKEEKRNVKSTAAVKGSEPRGESQKMDTSKGTAPPKARGRPKGTMATFFSKQAAQSDTTQVQEDKGAEKKVHEDRVKPAKQAKLPTTPTKRSPRKPLKRSPKKSPVKQGLKSQVSAKQPDLFAGLHDSDFEGDEEADSVASKDKDVKAKKTQKGTKGVSKKPKGRPKEAVAGAAIPAQRKRKRVQDLSSDEEAGEEAAKGDATKRRSSPASREGSGPARRRKRVKKLVSKMFMAEDGSMVTEKEWESVSTSASEEEREEVAPTTDSGQLPATISPRKAKGEAQSPSKGSKAVKQSSLMSFFAK